MKPAPVPTTTPGDLLRVSAATVVSAVGQNLAGPLAVLRANAQAARRLLARDCPDSPGLAAILADLLEDADRLESVVVALQEEPGDRIPRSRLQPEREIAVATALLDRSQRPSIVESDDRAPRITGRPGLIGAAVLHLLLCQPGAAGRVVRAQRPQPACLVVQVLGSGSAAPLPSVHTAAAGAAVARLGGSLDLDAAGGPRLEIPLEL